MNRIFFSLLLVAALVVLVGHSQVQASTDEVVIQLDYLNPGDTSPGGQGPWLTATFKSGTNDSGQSGVLLKLLNNLESGEFVGGQNGNGNGNGNSPNGWFFNFNGDVDKLHWDTGTENVPEVNMGNFKFPPENKFGTFDLKLTWPNKPSKRFGAGDTAQIFFYLDDGSLSPTDFLVANEQGVYSAAHIQGIADGGSAKVAAVPIPPTALLLGSGVLGLLGLRGRGGRPRK
ncbi:hypothetical protein SAMN02746041_02746 [Desulfacinum hydrothermale DSM 13146]|uniref:VPLPA-CTERM protein sorting domain-containing protein n=1 Tax=Desulfacinum hydrothermale DSM 13146 TaxID=1121390 RepID=A0A1W1XRZ6_9BACT|nr:hypothetical protein [Desulfacinum hydrothermale]SMC26750.1 hypothetical protein SAMN02746041_02746 [Desulfacinum hydrothermale DSM 13146]